MRLGFAFLAEAATMERDGTFAVIGGGVDVVKSKGFPAQKPVFVVIARIHYDQDEYGHHRFLGEIVDREGNRIFPLLEGEFEATPHRWHPERGNWVSVCLNAVGVEFPTPGDYAVRLSVDGKNIGNVTFEAVSEE